MYIVFLAVIIIGMIFYISMIFFLISLFISRKVNNNFFRNNIVNNHVKSYNDLEYIGIKKIHNSYNEYDDTSKYNDVNNATLKMFNTGDIDGLKDYFYDLFVKFEYAYNNLDYNMMKTLMTKQMYHNYYTGISLDLRSGKKRIINDIKKKKVILYELDSTVIKQTVSLMIQISYINYMMDSAGHIISGSRDNPVTEAFEVTFRKDFEKQDVLKCPNCGANVLGNRCDYCRTTLKNVEFKISNIKKIVEK